MTTTEKLIIKLLCRLFWRLTEAPGVARWPEEVKLFADAEVEAGGMDPETRDKLVRGYEKGAKWRK